MGILRECGLRQLLFGFALLMAALRGGAQPPPQRPDSAARLVARVELVNVEVTATHARGRFLTGLKRENFRVLDEGVEQPITHFAPIEAPVAMLVLVETSPAVYLIHRQHLEAAYALLDGLAADDQVALASYDQGARLLLPFTPDKGALAQALPALRYNLGRGELRLFDSIEAALNWLAPLPGKKALVLLSTGLDSSGASRWEELADKLCATEVAVFAVALGGELREFRGQPGEACHSSQTPMGFQQANRILEAMTELTGGRAWFPRAAGEFGTIYREIAATLRHRYSLGFRPPARDGRFHRIEVQLLDERGRVLAPAAKSPYRLVARRGYVAPAP